MNTIKLFVIISLILFNGCTDSSSKNGKSKLKKVDIKGKTTLSKSTVCVDLNLDSTCEANEPQTISDEKGKYLLKGVEVKNGDIILSEGGYNLVLLERNSAKLALKSSFFNSNKKININTISTLISTAMNSGLSYEKAKEKIANKYNLDINFIEVDTLSFLEDEKNNNIFLTVRAIEDRVLHSKNKTAPQQKVENGNLIITEDEADEALLNFDIFSFDLDGFKQKIAEYTLYGIFYYIDFITGKDDLNTSLIDNNISIPVADENDSISEEFVTRDDLVGVWNRDNTCLEIGSYSDIITTFYYTDDTNNGLSFVKDDSIINEFDEDNRRLYIKEFGEFFSVFWRVYDVYKSANIKNKLYFSYSDGSSESLTSFISMDACKAKLEVFP